jgi:putative ABC transport system substrate-binding protein
VPQITPPLLLCCLGLLAFPPAALSYDRVTVLVGNTSSAGDEFIREFRNQLAKNGIHQVSIRNVSDAAFVSTDNGVLVAVGVQALQHAANQKGNQPVLGVLIPQPAYGKIRASAVNSNISAIFLDQPPSRQMRLLHHLLPQAESVGILLGPTSTRGSEVLAKAAQDSGLKAVMATIQDEDDLTSSLKPLLETSSALLAVPDPLVHQRGTAQTLLLTSYRYQKPVIGYSQAYVTAGALAAVYTSPEDIARQAAEITSNYPDRQSALPPPQPPRYFSVGINRQVARSLNINIQDTEALTNDLIKEEQ